MLTAHMPDAQPTTSTNITILRVTMVSQRQPGETDHVVIGDETLNSEIVGAYEWWLITSGQSLLKTTDIKICPIIILVSQSFC